MGIAVAGGIVPVYDLDGQSPKIKAGRDLREITRVVEFDWANIDALILECVPPAPSLPGVYPSASYLYVDDIDIEGLHPDGEYASDRSGNVIIPTKAKATIKYSSKLGYEASTLITRRYGFSVETMPFPGANKLKWKNASTALGFAVIVDVEEIAARKRVILVDHSITWNRVVTVPWTAIKNNVGCVNSAVLNNGYFTNVAAETLLYIGAEISFTLSTDGSVVWTVEHRFQERRVLFNGTTYGWNDSYNPAGPNLIYWDRIVTNDANQTPLYETSSTFTDLFA